MTKPRPRPLSPLRLRILPLLCAGSLACARATPTPGAPISHGIAIDEGDTDGEPLVGVKVHATRLGEPQTLPLHGSKLYSGDRLWLAVRLNAPAYLYVLHASGAASAVLYPPGGIDRRYPSGSIRVPERGTFRLDEHPGTEHVLLVASRAPLSRVQSAGILAVYFSTVPPDAAPDAPPITAPSAAAHEAVIESNYPSHIEVKSVPRKVAEGARDGVTRAFRIVTAEHDRDTREGQTRGILYELEHEGEHGGGAVEIHGIPDEDGLVVIPVSFAHDERPRSPVTARSESR